MRPSPPSAKAFRVIAGKLALLAVSSLLALCLAEVAIRVLAGPLPSDLDHHRLLCEHDPLLGWRKIPNARRRFTMTEFDVEERINAKGLRGPEFTYEKPAGTFRILALGDSFTEGYTVESHEVFTEVLAARMGTGVQVINAGTGGYSTDQQLLFFRSEGRRYRPDLTLVMFVTNDVWFNAQPGYPRAPKPLFRAQDGGLILTNTPLPEPPHRTGTAGKSAPEPQRTGLRAALAARSKLYRFVRDRVKTNHLLYSAAIRLRLADPPEGESGSIAVPDSWRVFERRPAPEVLHAWTLTEKLLLALRDDVEAEGGRLLVVNVPPYFDIYEDRWAAVERRYGISRPAWSPSQVAETLAALCARNGIEFLDLTPDFSSAIEAGRDRSEPFYLPLDGHWSASGHRLAGELLAEYIAATHRTASPAEHSRMLDSRDPRD